MYSGLDARRSAILLALAGSALLITNCSGAAPSAERMLAREAVAVAAEDSALVGAAKANAANGGDIKSIADILKRIPAQHGIRPGTKMLGDETAYLGQPNSKVDFEILSGKLKIDHPFHPLGVNANFGEMNVYKTTAIGGAGIAACTSIRSKLYSNCITGAARTFQNKYFGEPDQTASIAEALTSPKAHTPTP